MCKMIKNIKALISVTIICLLLAACGTGGDFTSRENTSLAASSSPEVSSSSSASVSNIPSGTPESSSAESSSDLAAAYESLDAEYTPSQNTAVSTVSAEDSTNTENTQKPDTSKPALGSSAQEILSSMTLEEKVGQMFILRCPTGSGAEVAAEYQPGGYILFARDFKGKTRSRVISDIESYQNASRIPMFIGVDEEGGTVNRVSLYSEFRAAAFWSPMDLYRAGGWELIRSDTKEKSLLLRALGINMNFAPVCDVPVSESDYMYDRSFGTDPNLTCEFVRLNVSQTIDNGVMPMLKHFPGYGDNSNTHTGISNDKRSYENFANRDFLPFISGIESGAPVVLVSHNIVECMDADRPASLSYEVHRILREELGFDGLIITDDLIMDAITLYTDGSAAAVAAVKAGNDLLCSSDYETQVKAVINAVASGEISQERIDESVLRILEYKLKYQII